METTKRFTVVDTRTTTTKVFESNANTLGELKSELMDMGIDPTGMAIQEGLTRTELMDDNSILPHDVPYKGTTTNNLVFRLTQTNKMIKSGSCRSDAYRTIKELGLEELIKGILNKNYTNCTTSELEDCINAYRNNQCCSCEERHIEPKSTKVPVNIDTMPQVVMGLAKVIVHISNKLHEYDFLTKDDMKDIYNILTNSKTSNAVYSEDEIEEMFDF